MPFKWLFSCAQDAEPIDQENVDYDYLDIADFNTSTVDFQTSFSSELHLETSLIANNVSLMICYELNYFFLNKTFLLNGYFFMRKMQSLKVEPETSLSNKNKHFKVWNHVFSSFRTSSHGNLPYPYGRMVKTAICSRYKVARRDF